MNDLKVPKICLKELKEKHEGLEESYRRWADDYEEIILERNHLTKEIIKDIETWLEAHQEDHKAVKRCWNRVKSFNKLLAEGDVKPIKQLKDVPPAVKAFVTKHLENHMVYRESDGVLLPYLVYKSSYHPRNGDSPAYSDIRMTYDVHGERQTTYINFNYEDLIGNGLTVKEMFEQRGYLIETEEMEEAWRNSVAKYDDMIEETGAVYVGSGSCSQAGVDRWYSRSQYWFKEAVNNRCVIDFKGYYDEANRSEKFKSTRHQVSSELTDTEFRVEVPLHPYGHVFHLEEHIWLDVHVDNLEKYEFQGDALLNKLILPEQDKSLITILIEMSKIKLDDIVEGKTGGSFIMATGIPGTGKTLTAEVFSESVHKPLYKVQCSQLGISVDTVENKLKMVLNRASRWGAILLIDEADVYVRERGVDINQNAIVGVFLRTLEYYTGILFMTSNMETSIDDAIMSRATAHLVYEAPSIEDQRKIWQVLSDQFNSGLTGKQLDQLVKRFPRLVGRDIKALLKLSMMYAKGKEIPLTVDVFESIYAFIPNVLKNTKKEHKPIIDITDLETRG